MKGAGHLVARWVLTAGVFASVGIARGATELPDLALKKPASASASEDGNPPQNAVDGDADSRWCNADADPGAWWQVDLGTAQALGGCEIHWEHEGAAYKYIVQGSTDGKTWTALNDQRGSTDATQHHKLALSGEPARYVRIMVTGLDDGSWASFNEFKLFDAAGMKKLAPEEAKAFRPPAPLNEPSTAPASAPAK